MEKTISKQFGFTLVEILAVVFVIALGASVATFYLGGGTRSIEVEQSIKTLHLSMRFAIEEALLEHRQLGLRFERDQLAEEPQFRYHWLAYDREQKRWLDFANSVLNKQTLLPHLDVELSVDGQRIDVGDQDERRSDEIGFHLSDDHDDDVELIFPDLFFLSSGDFIDFTLEVIDELTDQRYRIEGDPLGSIRYLGSGEES